MIKRVSRIISWGCIAIMIMVPLVALYLLWSIDLFESFTKHAISLPIHWHTITKWQWYVLWLLTVLYLSFGVLGLYFLHRAFANFADGELFNLVNSRYIRVFSILLVVQAIARPLLFTLSSVLLSLNHPEGEKILSVSIGSSELMNIALAMILIVISELLVKANKLQNENQQFV